MFRALKAIFWETAEIVLVALAIILPIRFFLVQPFFVRGQSMEPTFSDGDYLVIDEISYRFRQPQRGEVVVFKFPGKTQDFYIKRIIGLPGETVEIRAGKVRIYNQDHPSGFTLNEPYLSSNLQRDENMRPVRLGEDEYFVLGDNRRASYDSRRWGTLKKDHIIGRVWIRPWPPVEPFLFAAPEYE